MWSETLALLVVPSPPTLANVTVVPNPEEPSRLTVFPPKEALRRARPLPSEQDMAIDGPPERRVGARSSIEAEHRQERLVDTPHLFVREMAAAST